MLTSIMQSSEQTTPGKNERHIFCKFEMGPMDGVYIALCGYKTRLPNFTPGKIATCVVCQDIEHSHLVGS